MDDKFPLVPLIDTNLLLGLEILFCFRYVVVDVYIEFLSELLKVLLSNLDCGIDDVKDLSLETS